MPPRIPANRLHFEELFQVVRQALERARAGQRVPEVPTQFVWPSTPRSEIVPSRLTRPVLDRRILTKPDEPAGVLRRLPEPPGPEPLTGVAPPGEIKSAADAMDSVLRRVFARNAPSRFLPEPELPPDTAGMRASDVRGIQRRGLGRALSMSDLRHEASRRLLEDVNKNPNRALAAHISALEPKMGRWVERWSTKVSKVPRRAGEARRRIEKADTTAGRGITSPQIRKDQQWLESRGLLKPPEIVGVQKIRGEETPTPEQVLLDKENFGTTKTALQYLREALETAKGLTAAQKRALAIKYGLEGEGESLVSPGGTLSDREVAQALGIKPASVRQHVSSGLINLRRVLDRAGLPFEKAERPRLPTDDPEFWPTRTQELSNILGKGGLRRFPSGEVQNWEHLPAARTNKLRENAPRPATPETTPRKTYAEWKSQYRNTGRSRLVPDPKGTILFQGIRYRKVPVRKTKEVDPNTGKTKTRWVNEENS